MIEAGSRLGPYEIIAPLGAGGMGEVWRARDTRLGRDVAVKVLPQHLAATADARARLEREARAISGLNHPHICTLFDIGHEDSVDFLVMELIEGETLAARLERGPLPTVELLPLAIQIAEALDYAHRQGIIHRDLKPANIMLTRSGAKLMDFGLARATTPASTPGDVTSGMTISRGLTAEGALVGTFLYMAPEQLDGLEADTRSDLWALGCVLFEMVTGTRAFAGKSQASLIGSIMHAEPAALTTLSPLTPPALARVVSACLAKDPEERIQTAHDVKLQLQWVADGGSLAGVPLPVATRRRHRERVAWVLVVLLGLAAAWGGASTLMRKTPPPAVTRFTLMPPPTVRTMTWPRISPDGLQLAFQASDSLGTRMIWVRPLDALIAHPLPGTEGAGRPFWSPDSRYLGYFLGNQLKKVAVAGGPPQLVCETRSAADGSWGAGDVILFDGAAGDSIRQVSANGGVASAATFLDRSVSEYQHAWPCFLPDGKNFLFLSASNQQERSWTLKKGSLGSQDVVDLGPLSSRMEFAEPDLVLFTIESTLMARHLDVGAGKWRGDPFPVAERVLVTGNGQANFSVSTDGVLVTMGGGVAERCELVWVDRNGKRLGREGQVGAYRDLALSPDGKRLAYGIVDPKGGAEDIWVRDLERGVASRLTFGDRNEIFPTWSPDGNRIAYSSNEKGPYSIWSRPADGTGNADSLYTNTFHTGVMDWSSDGRTIVFTAFPAGNPDLWVMRVGGPGETREIVGTRYTEGNGCLSPDGRWLAYASNESGRLEIYVRTFPEAGGKWQISTSGGQVPQWRGDGREIFYRGDGGTSLMAVPVEATSAFRVGTPVKLFDAVLSRSEISRNHYVAAADGQRFLLNLPLESNRVGVFDLVLNWTEEIAR